MKSNNKEAKIKKLEDQRNKAIKSLTDYKESRCCGHQNHSNKAYGSNCEVRKVMRLSNSNSLRH